MLLCRSQWPRGLRCRSSAACLLRLWVRIPPGAWMFVCWALCVVRYRSLQRTGHSSRGVLPTVARRVWSRNLEHEEAKAHYRAVKIQPQWVVTPGKQTNKQTNCPLDTWQETKHQQNRFTITHISQILLKDYCHTAIQEGKSATYNKHNITWLTCTKYCLHDIQVQYLHHCIHVTLRPREFRRVLHFHKNNKVQIVPHVVFTLDVFFEAHCLIIECSPIQSWKNNVNKWFFTFFTFCWPCIV